MINAQGPYKRLFLRRGGHCNRATQGLCQLSGINAHGGGSAIDEYALSVFKFSDLDQSSMCCETRNGQTGRLYWCQGSRPWDDVGGRDAQILLQSTLMGLEHHR